MPQALAFTVAFIIVKVLIIIFFFFVLGVLFSYFLDFYTYLVLKFTELFVLFQNFINYLAFDNLALDLQLKNVLMSMLNSLGITPTINTYFPLFISSTQLWVSILIVRFFYILAKNIIKSLLQINKAISL